jgi:hypothetical protein
MALEFLQASLLKEGLFFGKNSIILFEAHAGVAKLVDAQVLGTCGVILGGSSPLSGTLNLK